MRIYFDPSLLVALYLSESRTRALREWLAAQRVAIGLNVWQEIEFKNASRQKVMRGELNQGDLTRALRIFDDDCIHGRVVRRALSWDAVFTEAERLSKKLALSH